MINKVKILLGAFVVSILSSLLFFSLFELVSYESNMDLPDILILILALGTLALIPFVGSIVRVIAGYICKTKLGFSLFQSKMTQLISCILYLIEVYLYANIYCHTLAFDEGLGFVLGLFFMLVITAFEMLLLIGLLVIERKKQ
ncbi:MAG: hypothetical protein E7292_03915 [Lachnospiraceae bacterium]|nr:hypothetical protein [Lachnospiraceae bacterium]